MTRAATAVAWLTAAVFLALAFMLAVVLPIHAQDALTSGEWSRLISEHWHLHYDAATPQEYGRPLYYVLQGGLWGIFGFHEPLGRLLDADAAPARRLPDRPAALGQAIAARVTSAARTRSSLTWRQAGLC